MRVAAPFGVISNRIRETSYRFQLEMHDLCLLLLAASKGTVCFMRQPLIERYSRFRCFVMILAHTRYKMTMTMIE